MNKVIPAISIPLAAIIIGVVVFAFPTNVEYDDDPDNDDNLRKQHESIWSGPLAVTQYEHRLGEDVFFLIRGLQPDEIGAIGVFTPEGILYKSFEYDGSKKPDFNQYFFPDTFAEFDICKPEQLVGIWKVVFADNSYPPLEFKIINEYIAGGEAAITVVC